MKRIGADMLDNLDRQLAAGTMSKSEYDSRRIEVEDIIRSGKDIDMSAGERAGRIIAGVVIFLIGFVIAGIVAANAVNGRAGIFGIIVIAACGFVGWRVAHPRAR